MRLYLKHTHIRRDLDTLWCCHSLRSLACILALDTSRLPNSRSAVGLTVYAQSQAARMSFEWQDALHAPPPPPVAMSTVVGADGTVVQLNLVSSPLEVRWLLSETVGVVCDACSVG